MNQLYGLQVKSGGNRTLGCSSSFISKSRSGTPEGRPDSESESPRARLAERPLCSHPLECCFKLGGTLRRPIPNVRVEILDLKVSQ